jgi:putative transposase
VARRKLGERPNRGLVDSLCLGRAHSRDLPGTDHPSALAQLGRVVDGLGPWFPAAAGMLEEAAEDVLAHLHFPEEHRRRLHSTNPLERLHKEVKRRTAVVGIFPDRTSLVRLVGMLLAEQDDEWSITDRRYFTFESMARISEPEGGVPTELLAAIA